MTENDPIFSRLQELDRPSPSEPLAASVRTQAHALMRRHARRERFVAMLVMATAVVYVGWALRFASALYP
jgi:hypothetical protein